MNSAIGIVILLLTGMVTYKGFIDQEYRDRYMMYTDGVLLDKEYDRLLSAGFLHANWLHFGFNMIALTAFSWSLEYELGALRFVIVYLGSLVGGNLLALYLHRNHGDYRGLGASGAISGVIFAAIILYPDIEISLILIPIGIKSWLFGLLFIVISIFGIKSQADNIGHDAHLGGALVGILLTILMRPSIVLTNWWIILLLLLPTLAFLILIVRNPAVLLIDNYWGEDIRRMRQPKPPRKKEQVSLDDLLEKIRREGLDSLSKREREILERYKDEM